ncbi:FAD-binding oxidoreductase [bacterium]|nr:FAD-binding oxidoreductase [bacterium]
MSKIGHYLQEHLSGEVMDSIDARKYFASDSSILFQPPALAIYPRSENDIRKAIRFSWQLAERGRLIPISSRGLGSDISGAALTKGVLLVFSAHINRILELDNKDDFITVEAGINFGKLQQTLNTHSKFIPTYPSNPDYATIGGVISNNTIGEKSFKYGSIAKQIKSIRIVLANGEVITVKKLSKRELNKKIGLNTFEGEIYRGLNNLLEDNKELISKTKLDVEFNSAGYNLADITKDKGFDLTPLFVGSQSTLGIITEVTLKTTPSPDDKTLLVASLNDLNTLQGLVNEFMNMKNRPSSFEVVNKSLIDAVKNINSNYLKDSLSKDPKEYTVFIEYDDTKRSKLVKRAKKTILKFTEEVVVLKDPSEQEKYWKIREASSVYIGQNDGSLKASPIIEDAGVSPYRLSDLVDGAHQIFNSVGINNPPMWGHLGTGVMHFYPKLNLASVGDKQKVFKIMDGYYKLIVSLGGSISSENSDGKLKAPYLEMQYGSEVYALLKKVKEVFDPYSMFAPGVKFGTTKDELKEIIKPEFALYQQFNHLPRS